MLTLKKSALLGLVVLGLIVGSFLWNQASPMVAYGDSGNIQIASESGGNGGG